MDTTHIMSDPRSGKLGMINEDNDDDGDDDDDDANETACINKYTLIRKLCQI